MSTALSDTQKAAMLAGRKAARMASTPENNAILTQFQAETVRRASLYLPSAKNAFLKAFTGKAKVAAIKAKCIECCNFERKQVETCAVPGCPLFQYRPFRGSATTTGAAQ
jgi:hypothetical protein